jgi:hypothetical protein
MRARANAKLNSWSNPMLTTQDTTNFAPFTPPPIAAATHATTAVHGYDARLTAATNASLTEFGGEGIYIELTRLNQLPPPEQPASQTLTRSASNQTISEPDAAASAYQYPTGFNPATGELTVVSNTVNKAQRELPSMEVPSFSLGGTSILLPVQGSSSTDDGPSSAAGADALARADGGGGDMDSIVPVTAGGLLPSITALSKKKGTTTTTKSKKKFKQLSKAFERKESVVGLLSDDGDATAPDENGMFSI